MNKGKIELEYYGDIVGAIMWNYGDLYKIKFAYWGREITEVFHKSEIKSYDESSINYEIVPDETPTVFEGEPDTAEPVAEPQQKEVMVHLLPCGCANECEGHDDSQMNLPG